MVRSRNRIVARAHFGGMIPGDMILADMRPGQFYRVRAPPVHYFTPHGAACCNVG